LERQFFGAIFSRQYLAPNFPANFSFFNRALFLQLLGITDPILPLENLFKKIFLGGIFDTLQETFYGKPEEESSEAAG